MNRAAMKNRVHTKPFIKFVIHQGSNVHLIKHFSDESGCGEEK